MNLVFVPFKKEYCYSPSKFRSHPAKLTWLKITFVLYMHDLSHATWVYSHMCYTPRELTHAQGQSYIPFKVCKWTPEPIILHQLFRFNTIWTPRIYCIAPDTHLKDILFSSSLFYFIRKLFTWGCGYVVKLVDEYSIHKFIQQYAIFHFSYYPNCFYSFFSFFVSS